MIPVDQTRFGVGGNCLAACLASVLHVALDDVPDLSQAADWSEQRLLLNAWLEAFGLRAIVVSGPPPAELGHARTIVSGTTARSDLMHATVWRGQQLEHDPHPSRAGLVTVEDTLVFVELLAFEPTPAADVSKLDLEEVGAFIGAELAREPGITCEGVIEKACVRFGEPLASKLTAIARQWATEAVP